MGVIEKKEEKFKDFWIRWTDKHRLVIEHGDDTSPELLFIKGSSSEEYCKWIDKEVISF